MEFRNDIGRTQRLMAVSSAEIACRKAIMDNLSVKSDSRIIDISCGAGHLLELLAKALGPAGAIYSLDPNEELTFYLETIRDKLMKKREPPMRR